MVKLEIRPRAKSIAAVKRSCPPQSVPNQLKILTPVGMAMAMVVSAKALFTTGPKPVANMWWLHTVKPIKPMRMPEKTITG